uniref:Uncharacterized protein n=1 Tax=Mesocestoides corti TaxID=53468 RepID=A0A5K3FJD5_MESCO
MTIEPVLMGWQFLGSPTTGKRSRTATRLSFNIATNTLLLLLLLFLHRRSLLHVHRRHHLQIVFANDSIISTTTNTTTITTTATTTTTFHVVPSLRVPSQLLPDSGLRDDVNTAPREPKMMTTTSTKLISTSTNSTSTDNTQTPHPENYQPHQPWLRQTRQYYCCCK